MDHPIVLGQSDFRTIRHSGQYYVDKSALIGEVLQAPFLVLLLPRPRRFGKTLNQTMLQAFFDDRQDARSLFEGLAITAQPRAMQHLNGYPTLFLTLKDMSHNDWSECQEAFKLLIAELIEVHHPRIRQVATEVEQQALDDLRWQRAGLAQCQRALRLLTDLLARESGRKVVVLVDEYDNPIHRSAAGDYQEQVLNFLRNFLGAALKDNASLARAVITGVLRIGRESIYSDLNNLGVYSILEQPCATAFGFTESEVQQILRDHGLLDRQAEVRAWYDGYRFGGQTIYNPWSILSLASSTGGRIQPYWLNTSSNDLARDLIIKGQGYHLKDLETLLTGGAISRALDVSISLRDLQPEALWNLLLFSGYLTTRSYDAKTETGALAIPNQEIRMFFERVVLQWFGPPQRATQILDHLLAGNMEAFKALLTETFATIVSYHDTAGRQPEQIYHVFFIGLLLQWSERYLIESNIEAGQGRADLLLIPKRADDPGFIFEFKSQESENQHNLEIGAQAAVGQVMARDYAARLRKHGVAHWLVIGLACHGKQLGLAWHRCLDEADQTGQADQKEALRSAIATLTHQLGADHPSVCSAKAALQALEQTNKPSGNSEL